MLTIIEAIAEAKGFGAEEFKGVALDEIGIAISAIQEENGVSQEPPANYEEENETDPKALRVQLARKRFAKAMKTKYDYSQEYFAYARLVGEAEAFRLEKQHWLECYNVTVTQPTCY